VLCVSSTTKTQSIPEPLRYIAVALLFAACGYWSAAYLLGDKFPVYMPMMLPVPFALLCALLFLHTVRVIIAAPLVIAVWPVAFWTAKFVGMSRGGDDVTPACVGGLIGGLGSVLCASIGCEKLISIRPLFGGSLIGAISALPFSPWLNLFYSNLNGPPPPPPFAAFAIWQAVVGTYLYAICTHANKKEVQSEASNVETVAEP
jgi:hypothetical protein